MHSSRMRNARVLTVSRNIPCISEGGSAQPPPRCRPLPPLEADSPGCRPPGYRLPIWIQTPHPGGRPPTLDADPPGGRPPGRMTCDACLEATSPPPTMDRMTGACENITLPQTSFAGGKKKPTGLSVRLLTMVKFEISSQNWMSTAKLS